MFDLLSKLRELGESLPESAKVAPVDVPNIFAGLIHYAETGSLDPLPAGGEGTPAAAAPDQSARIAELEAQLAAQASRAVVSEPDADDQHSSSTAPSESTGGSSPEAGQAVLTGGASGGSSSAAGAPPLPAAPTDSPPTPAS